MKVCELQHKSNNFFIFEHPAYADSWKKTCVERIRSLPGVETAMFHQCRFGLRSPGGSLLRKPTMLTSNVPAIQQNFGKTFCNCSMPHMCIQGSEFGISVALHAAHYPKAMCIALADSCV